MSDTVENDSTVKPEALVPPPDRVGDTLRKERVTRRITLETIAKDLKLNVRYIKAIEANQYHDLPPDPYIRVYLRTIAKYLLLDPEKILNAFFAESGIVREKSTREISAKIKMNGMESEKSYKPWIIIIGIIVVLAIVSLVTNKISSPSGGPIPASKNSPATAADSSVNLATDSLSSLGEDSIPVNLRPADDSLVSTLGVDTVLKPDQVVKTNTDSIVLVISALADSVWIQSFRDGAGMRTFVKKNGSHRIVARDSINIHVGNNPAVDYVLNGKPRKIPGRGVVFVKISRSSLEMWGQIKWNMVFKGRL